MKTFTSLTCVFILFCLVSGCTVEEETVIEETSVFKVTEGISNQLSGKFSYTEYCSQTDLIAGQHYNVGTVTTKIEEPNLIITYTTINGWTLDETHLTIGGCDTGIFAGDRIKIGQFEHSENHSEGVTEVSYSIDLNYVDDIYCFAAHASVISSEGTQETAWGEGTEFGGKNGWKMYVEGNLEDCYRVDVIK